MTDSPFFKPELLKSRSAGGEISLGATLLKIQFKVTEMKVKFPNIISAIYACTYLPNKSHYVSKR